jgi:hypothetical protein
MLVYPMGLLNLDRYPLWFASSCPEQLPMVSGRVKCSLAPIKPMVKPLSPMVSISTV